MKEGHSIFLADVVHVPSDDLLNAGEGEIEFRWSDALLGWECLAIDCDGFCHRRMPVHSGGGSLELVDLGQDYIRLRFDPALAQKLRLTEEIEIRFTLSDGDLRQLQRMFDYLSGKLD